MGWVPARKKSCESGFSLIELMAASLILGVTITGVMSILGTGRALEFQNKLRREARIFAADALEDSTLHYSQYPSLAIASVPSTTRTVQLESGSAHPVNADLTVTIMSISTETWADVSGTQVVPYMSIRVNVVWNVAGQADSVLILKRIAEVR